MKPVATSEDRQKTNEEGEVTPSNEKELKVFNDSLKGLSPKQKEEWLPILHKQYSERFLKDNDRIWTVTSIFIPLSLAGLGALREGKLPEVIALGLGSIALVCFWFLVCAKHRQFQDDGRDILKVIEDQIGIKSPETPFERNSEGFALAKWLRKPSIRQARVCVLYFIITVWFVAMGYTIYTSCLAKSPAPPPTKPIQIINNNSYQ